MDWSRFREALRQGCVDPLEACIKQGGGKGGSPPPAPDYRGAAQETSAGNLDATRYATAANRINQYTPYGSQTYERSSLPDNRYSPEDPRYQPMDQWSSTINLDPRAQRTLDTQMNLSKQMGDVTTGALPRVQQEMSRGFDASNVPQLRSGVEGLSPEVMQRASDAAYQGATRRLDPQWGQREQQTRTMLQNQGLVSGGEAYTNAMRDFDTSRNDAYAQARDESVRQGLQAQAQQFGQGSQNVALNNQAAAQQMQQNQFLRSVPLNELNALRTGAQVQNPTFNQPGMQQTTAGPNYSGAAQAGGQYAGDLYNSQIGQQNAMTSGLFGLGAAGVGAMPWGRMLGF